MTVPRVPSTNTQVTRQNAPRATFVRVGSQRCARVPLPDDGEGLSYEAAEPPHVEVDDTEPALPLGFSLPGDGPWDSRPYDPDADR
ncbi:MAG: hypothetical protein AAGA99_21155 [Actinomycetota bacterium]